MNSTMQDAPLSITELFRHGAEVFPDSEMITFEGERARHTQLREGGRAGEPPRRCAAHAWDRSPAIASPRSAGTTRSTSRRTSRFRAWERCCTRSTCASHRRSSRRSSTTREDRVVIVDDSLAPLLASVIEQCPSVEKVIVVGSGAVSGLGDTLAYETLLAAASPTFDVAGDRRTQCGVHVLHDGHHRRSRRALRTAIARCILHSFAVWATFRLDDNGRLLIIVPMFHVNAWGTPYAGWMVGSDLLLPGRFLQPQGLCDFITQERPTFTGGVPTILTALLNHVQTNGGDVSSIKTAVCGGSAVPATLIAAYRRRARYRVVAGVGDDRDEPHRLDRLSAQGHRARGRDALPGQDRSCRCRACSCASSMTAAQRSPHDGEAVGEIEVRGPWITGSYYNAEAPEKFHDGWLRTGDVGNIDARGYVQITDRSKDVIKSGGEWISSVELETLLVGHPAVADAAVVGVPDERWAERPLATVVLKPGKSATPEELREFLAPKVARWWLPERWAFVDELPKTSVGKLDKKVIRADYAAGKYPVVELTAASR